MLTQQFPALRRQLWAVGLVSLIFLPTVCLTGRDAWNMDVNSALLGKGSALVGKNKMEPWLIRHYLVVDTNRSDLGCGDTFRILPTTLRLHPDYQMTLPFSGPGTPPSTC